MKASRDGAFNPVKRHRFRRATAWWPSRATSRSASTTCIRRRSGRRSSRAAPGRAQIVALAALVALVCVFYPGFVSLSLNDGRLVRPFTGTVRSQFAYWIVCPHDALKSPRIRAIRDWLHDEAVRQPPLNDASLARRF